MGEAQTVIVKAIAGLQDCNMIRNLKLNSLEKEAAEGDSPVNVSIAMIAVS